MNNSKISGGRQVVDPESLRPVLSHANFMEVKQGMVWGPRIISDIELVLVVSGSLRYTTLDYSCVAQAGDVLFIKPERHTLSVLNSNTKTVISCIHFEPLAGSIYSEGAYRLTPQPPNVISTGGDYEVRDLFMRCARVTEGYSPFRKARTSAILSEIWILLCEAIISKGEPGPSHRMSLMLSYIRRNLTSPMDRTIIASEFSLTPQYVNTLFKKELNITPTEFIHRERIQLASRLILKKGLSVKEAAAQVGFNDQSYFSRIFKRIMKFPPAMLTTKRPR